MQAVAQNVHDETGGHLDRLVVTHEHWDHLSGFLQAQAIFDTVEVDEVWLAWTEDPDDELAGGVAEAKQQALDGVVAAAKLADAGKSPAAKRTLAQLDALLELPGRPGAAGTQDDGQGARVGQGPAKAKIKFLRPGEQLFDLPGCRACASTSSGRRTTGG